MELVDTSKNEFPERRKYPRYECNIIDSLNQKITNLSAAGARLESPRPYHLHEEIPLNFPVSSLNGNEARLQGTAIVTRRSDGLGALRHKYGLIFSRLSSDAQKLLDLHLGLEKQRKESQLDRLVFYRLPRTHVVSNGDKFRFEMTLPDGNLTQFDLVNYSESGARIAVKGQPLHTQIGSVWNQCRIYLNEHLLFSGSVEIRDLQEKDSHVEYGVAFCSDTLRLSRIDAVRKLEVLEEKFDAAFSEFNGEFCAPPDFKVAVSDFRYFLEKMKNVIDESESEINRMESQEEREWLNNRIQDRWGHLMKDKLHALIRRINYSIRNFTQDEHKKQQIYFREQVSHLTNACALYKRAFEKPLGYAGDYLMLDVLVGRAEDGPTERVPV